MLSENGGKMAEKIFEIRIVNVNNMSASAREEIRREVARKPPAFKEKFEGFAKVTYVTASPPRIAKIEPIMGSIIEEFKSIGGDFSVF